MQSNKDELQEAAEDLRFLLGRGYKKKSALIFVANRYLLDKDERNFLVRSIFSSPKSANRKRKIINISEIENMLLLVDGYNVLITVESVLTHDDRALVLCDDGLLRDVNAVFGKYKFNEMTEKGLREILSVIKKYNPLYIDFFFDRPVSFSGKLATLTQSIMDSYGLQGKVNLSGTVDFEIKKQANYANGIVATSDGVIIDRVDKIVDIPFYIYKITNKI